MSLRKFRKNSRLTPRRKSVRPRLEILEDLCLLSTGALDTAIAGSALAITQPVGTVNNAATATALPQSDAATQARLSAAYGQVPMSFEANQGQTDAQVQFVSRGSGYTLFLAGGEAVLSLQKPAAPPTSTGPVPPAPAVSVLRVQLVGANVAPAATGLDALPGKSNYLTGSDPSLWHVDVPNYAQVEYRDVYPGIGLTYYGNQGQLEYDFVVAPAADPGTIALSFQGANKIEVDSQGDLILHTGGGDVVEHAPVLYQEIDGARRAVSGAYVVQGDHQVGFRVGAHDASKPLVIDPVLVYSTFLGGNGDDGARAIAVDSAGNAYVTGSTSSTDLPGSAGSAQVWNGGGYDAFVTKLNAAGTAVLYTTYLGGAGNEHGRGIAVDDSGEAYVTGNSSSRPFPDGTPLQTEYPNGPAAFVAKLNATGSAFVYAFALGGNGANYGNAIAVGRDGSAYVTGSTETTDFPTTKGAFQEGPGKTGFYSPSTFVTKINPAGTALAYSTYLHGNTGGLYTALSSDGGNGIAVDGDGNAYVTGSTSEGDFPIRSSATLGAPKQGYAVGAFVAKLNAAGSDLIYSAVLKGTQQIHTKDGDFFTETSGKAIALDPHGFAYIAGYTDAADLPLVGAPQPSLGNDPGADATFLYTDAFVAKFTQDGQGLVYTTLIGGNGDDVGRGIAVDPAGHAYVTGETSSTDFPLKDAIQSTFGGPSPNPYPAPLRNAFAAKLSLDGHALVYSTYLGGGGGDRGYGIAVDGVGNAYVAGYTSSADFPVTPATNPLQATLNTPADAFISKISGRFLTVTGIPLVLSKNVPVSGPVAAFTTLDTKAQANQFTATINWGDGTISPSASTSITQPGGPGTPFQVLGSHSYSKLGTFPVVVTIHDKLDDRDATTATNVSRLMGNQNETAITIDPSNPSREFVVSNDEGSAASILAGGRGIFASYSTDGGVTWQASDPLDHRIADGDDSLITASGDPKAAFDSFGNLFLTYLSADHKTVAVALSINGGKTFARLGSFDETGANGLDQPSIATGPGPGNTPSMPKGSVWITYEDATANQIEAAGTLVSGLGIVTPFDPFAADVPGSTGGNFGSVDVGPKGQVLVNWQTRATTDGNPTPDLGPADVLVSLDPDGLGKAGFGPGSVATTTNIGGRTPVLPQFTRTIDAEANLAWDRSGGPHDGRVYLAYTNSSTPDSVDTFLEMRTSDDDGKTWSDPVRVDDTNGTSTLFLPSIAVDQTTGDVAVAWYDTRNDANDKQTQFFTAVSGDGGKTFSANVPVSLGMSDATLDGSSDPSYKLDDFGQIIQYGDYTGVAFHGGLLAPAWSDNSPALGGNGDLPQMDVAAARVFVAHVTVTAPVVTALPVSATEGKTFAGPIATFTDADTTLDPGSFSVPAIDWGDGTTTAGFVRQLGGDTKFTVEGNHMYRKAGAYPIVVTVMDNVNHLTASSSGVAQVADQPLTATTLDFDAGEGEQFNESVATFTDADSNGQASFYTATIDWGDATIPSPGGIQADGRGGFTVTGSHAFKEEGTYTVTITINDVGGASTTVTNSISIDDATLTANSRALTPIVGQLFGAVVASFADDDLQGGYTDYTARINWDDGHSTDGVIAMVTAADGTHSFTVTSTSTYAAIGSYSVTVSIKDAGGSTITALSTATVAHPPPVAQASPPAIQALQGIPTGMLDLAAFTVPGGLETGPGHYSAKLSWGDGGPPDGSTLTLGQDTITVSGSHTYTKAGAFLPVVTLTDDTGGFATVVDTVNVLADVSSRVHTVSSGLIFNPLSQVFNGHVTYTNISTTDITGPVPVVFHGLPAGVKLDNATGATFPGDPLITDAVATLAPGQSRDVLVQFRDPTFTAITYSLKVFDPPPAGAAATDQIAQTYGKLPLSFEVNQGQADAQVQFLARGSGYVLLLTPDQAVLGLQKPAVAGASPQPAESASLHLQLVGAAPTPRVVGLDQLPGTSNYLTGNDPTQWHTDIPTYARVEYQQVYPGVDLDYYGNQGQLEYDFVIAPGTDPGVIRLNVQGADTVALDAQGNLILHTASGDVVQRAPVIYQEVGGARQTVSGHYVLGAEGQVGFAVGAYDASRPLVIDPVLSYSTYLGGSGENDGNAIAVDAAGNAYVTGSTASTDFPTANPLQPAKSGGARISNVFVAKLNAAGSALDYSTYLDGSVTDEVRGESEGKGIAVDAAGNAYVTGDTTSTNFPTTPGAFQPVQAVAKWSFIHAFVAKLNAAGSALVYSTYLSGSDIDKAQGIAVDGAGNAYVTGFTMSDNFPTTPGAFQPANGGAEDAFVAKLNAAGSALVYSTYLGGTSTDIGKGIAVDGAGNAYVTGSTYSTNFPTANALQAAYGGIEDAFVAKLNASGTALVYSTYLGGSSGDEGNGIAVDGAGNAYVTGRTRSANFPTANALQPAIGGIEDAFVAKLNASGTALVYSTYLGGSKGADGYGIAADGAGNAYVTGSTESDNFPTTPGAFQPAFVGSGDAFVAKLNAAGSALVYSTYLGGGNQDIGFGIAVDGAGNAYVTGETISTDFPTANPLQPAIGGVDVYNAFITKIATRTTVPGNLRVTSQPITAVEGTAFSGVVATFNDTDHDPAGSFTATVDWGDGTTSAGTITADAGGGFDVRASHTFHEEGFFPLTVTIRDTDRSTAKASSTDPVTDGAGAVTYHISLDTSALDRTSGALAIQFNAGSIPGGQAASVTLTHFTTTGGSLAGAATDRGDSSGSVAGTAQLKNSAVLNEITQGVTFGTSLSFDVAISGDAVEHPLSGLIGSAFAIQLLAADGVTPQSTGDPSGAVLVVDANPDGSKTVTDVPSSGSGGSPAANVSNVASGPNVADAPLAATGTTITLTTGVPFSGTVASFTDADPTGAASDFSATIDWGDGTTLTGTIQANGHGGFDVTADKLYGKAGNNTLTIAITDLGGARALTTTQVHVNPAPAAVLTVSGQAPPGQVALSPSNTLTYSFTVTNTGNSPATAVRLTARLPGTVSFVSGDHGASVSGGVVTLDFGTLGAGGTATARFTVSPTTAGPAGLDALVASANATSAGTHVAATVLPPAGIDHAPTVTGLIRTGFHMRPTILVLTFDAPLDPLQARKVGHYRIVTLGGPGRGGSRAGHVIGVRAAVYDPATLTVTLFPTERLDIHNRYRLRVKGTAKHGLTGVAGVPLDGKGDGIPGSDFEAVITWRTLVMPDLPHPHSTLHANRSPEGHHSRFTESITDHAVDALAASGRLRTWLHRTWHRHSDTSPAVSQGSGSARGGNASGRPFGSRPWSRSRP